MMKSKLTFLVVAILSFTSFKLFAYQKFCGNMLQYQPELIKYRNGAPGVVCINLLPNNAFATYIEYSNSEGNFRTFGFGYRSPNSNTNNFSLMLADVRKDPADGNRTAGIAMGYGNLPRWSTDSLDNFMSSFVVTQGRDISGAWFLTPPNTLGADYVSDRTMFAPQVPPLISLVKEHWKLGKCNVSHPNVRIYTTILPDRMIKRCVFEENRKVLAWIAFGQIWNKPFIELGGGNNIDVFGNRAYRAGKLCAQSNVECGGGYTINDIRFSIEPNGQEKQTVFYGNGTTEDWLYNIDI